MSRAIRTRGRIDPIFVEHLDALDNVLADVVTDDDIVVTLGAGSIGGYAQQLVKRAGEGVS